MSAKCKWTVWFAGRKRWNWNWKRNFHRKVLNILGVINQTKIVICRSYFRNEGSGHWQTEVVKILSSRQVNIFFWSKYVIGIFFSRRKLHWTVHVVVNRFAAMNCEWNGHRDP
jgi:hypothetical protein